MIVPLFLLLLVAAVVTRGARVTLPPSPVIRVEHEYTGSATTGSWITITLKHGATTANVKRIVWCKSVTPNPLRFGDRIPPPIDDCRGAGLMHLVLWEGAAPAAAAGVEMPANEPDTIYIDPATLGGWDTRHQFNVIVTVDKVADPTAAAAVRGNLELVQVVRFNPVAPVAAPVALAAPAAAVPVVVSPVPAVAAPAAVVPAVVPPVAVPAVASVAVVSPATASPKASPEDESHPWPAVLITFFTGLAVIGCITMYTFLKRKSRGTTTTTRTGGKVLSGYLFFDPKLSEAAAAVPDDIEMQDIQAEDEDLRILVKLGSGANPAFQLNRETQQ
jgi:hypothetical protein